MARIDVKNGFSFNLVNLDLNSIYEAYNYVATDTVFQAQYGTGYSDTFRGFGFSYNAVGEPTGGTVTSYQAVYGGHSPSPSPASLSPQSASLRQPKRGRTRMTSL